MKKLYAKIQAFSQSSEENKTQSTLIFGFILFPIIAMFVLFFWVLIVI